MEQTRTRVVLRGLELRYVLTIGILDRQGEVSVEQLVSLVDALGYALDGRPSKVISDALRWEMRKGRVVRRGRGRYAVDRVPRSTEWWMRRRVAALDG